MRRIVGPFLALLGLAVLESSVARWLQATLPIPILIPAILLLAITLPIRRLFPLAVLGGLAGEVTSGEAPGNLFAGLVITPIALRILFRRPLSDYPRTTQGLIAAGAACVLFLALHAVASPSDLVSPIALSTLLRRVVLPAAVSGILVFIAGRMLPARLRTE